MQAKKLPVLHTRRKHEKARLVVFIQTGEGDDHTADEVRSFRARDAGVSNGQCLFTLLRKQNLRQEQLDQREEELARREKELKQKIKELKELKKEDEEDEA